MKKAIIAGVVVVVAALGGLASVLALDPARFAPLVEAELSRLAGQPITINGAVALSWFPDPAIAAADIATVPDSPVAIRIARVRVQLSWRALFGGDVVARGVQVLSPRIDLPAEAVGSFAALAVPPPAADGQSRRAAGSATASEVVVSDGRVRIVGADAPLEIGGVELRIVQADRSQRRVTASFVVGGLRTEIDGRLQPITANGLARFDAEFAVPEADVRGKASGQLRFDPAAPAGVTDVRLTTTAEAQRLGDMLALMGVDVPGDQPMAWSQPVNLSAEVIGDGSAVTADPISIDVAGEVARGRLALSLAARRFEIVATLSGLVAERWLALPIAVTRAAGAPDTSWQGTLSVAAPLFTVGGQVGRDGALDAALADGQWTIARLAATLPGQAAFDASGFVRGEGDDALLDGAWSLSARDPRGFFSWLGVATDTVQADRLAVFDARGTVLGAASGVEFSDVAIRLDNATARGRAGIVFGPRPRYRVQASIDQFVLDPYRAALAALFAPAALPPAETSTYGITAPPEPVSALARADADVRVDIEKLIAGDAAAGSGAIDFDLTAGRLSLRALALRDVGGVSVFATGALANLGTVPAAEALEITASAADRRAVARAWGIAASSRWDGVFPFSATATLNGPQIGAAFALNATLGSAEGRAAGTLAWADNAPRGALDIALSDSRPEQLVRALAGVDAPGIDGPATARGKVELSPGLVTWSEARLDVGKSTLTTTGKIETKPGAETFTINLDEVSFDWPSAGAASAAAGAPRAWPEAAFAPFWPPSARGSIRIAGPALRWRGLKLADFSAVLSFDDNALELSQWRGSIFGGPAQVQLRVDNAPAPAARLQLLIDDAKPAEVFAWLGTAAGGDGSVDLALGLATDGLSPRAWISRLSGSGSFRIETLQRQRPADQAGPLSFLTAPATAAGASAARVATGAAFRIVDGKLSFQDGSLTTNAYTGPLRGEIDFAAWRMNLSATLRAPAGVGAGLRVNAEGAPDAPTVKVTQEK